MKNNSAVPRLTLGLPTYNGEPFLAESLDASSRRRLSRKWTPCSTRWPKKPWDSQRARCPP